MSGTLLTAIRHPDHISACLLRKKLAYFNISIIIEIVNQEDENERTIRFADMFAAMGTESRLRIMQVLLSAHPAGMVVGEIQSELGISASNLSHHLEKLKNEDLVLVQREGTFLRYTANTAALEAVLSFLYAECCTRNKAIRPEAIVPLCK
ncbi:ArsR/SmtB family transcription factor [Bryobacter aggregatus]|uniref:ArsR/SmtB family transcription factor n=1 Tax=Bryobacter aggregatus TaxID=360054 RepID=UPI00192E2F0B|nr:metalloregulator ArsR/SmtB family transcription factor [Bryobacter aggregatus]